MNLPTYAVYEQLDFRGPLSPHRPLHRSFWWLRLFPPAALSLSASSSPPAFCKLDIFGGGYRNEAIAETPKMRKVKTHSPPDRCSNEEQDHTRNQGCSPLRVVVHPIIFAFLLRVPLRVFGFSVLDIHVLALVVELVRRKRINTC